MISSLSCLPTKWPPSKSSVRISLSSIAGKPYCRGISKTSYPANRLQLDTDQNIDQYLQSFEIENSKNNQYTLKINNEKSAHDLLQKLVSDNIQINKFEIMKPTLNDIFIEKVGAQNEIK